MSGVDVTISRPVATCPGCGVTSQKHVNMLMHATQGPVPSFDVPASALLKCGCGRLFDVSVDSVTHE